MDDEGQHLKKYAEERCEEAFTALVRMHAGMVFGTSFRRSGDREAAEEISQNVFTILARKAPRLNGNGSLAGWLHRTTLLETRNYLQCQRRQRKKMLALTEFEQSRSSETSEMHTALPVLDEAIDKLSAGDRRVILLRFFDGLSMREIAAATGKTEAASQKQSHRALQKLADLLKRKGVTVSVSVLASQMALETSKAATYQMAATLSQTALAGAASISTATLVSNTILTMGSMKSIIAVTTLATASVIVPVSLMGNRSDEVAPPAESASEGNADQGQLTGAQLLEKLLEHLRQRNGADHVETLFVEMGNALGLTPEKEKELRELILEHKRQQLDLEWSVAKGTLKLTEEEAKDRHYKIRLTHRQAAIDAVGKEGLVSYNKHAIEQGSELLEILHDLNPDQVDALGPFDLDDHIQSSTP